MPVPQVVGQVATDLVVHVDAELLAAHPDDLTRLQGLIAYTGFLGFEQVNYADRSANPWRVVGGIEFRAVTLVGQLPGG